MSIKRSHTNLLKTSVQRQTRRWRDAGRARGREAGVRWPQDEGHAIWHAVRSKILLLWMWSLDISRKSLQLFVCLSLHLSPFRSQSVSALGHVEAECCFLDLLGRLCRMWCQRFKFITALSCRQCCWPWLCLLAISCMEKLIRCLLSNTSNSRSICYSSSNNNKQQGQRLG